MRACRPGGRLVVAHPAAEAELMPSPVLLDDLLEVLELLLGRVAPVAVAR